MEQNATKTERTVLKHKLIYDYMNTACVCSTFYSMVNLYFTDRKFLEAKCVTDMQSKFPFPFFKFASTKFKRY